MTFDITSLYVPYRNAYVNWQRRTCSICGTCKDCVCLGTSSTSCGALTAGVYDPHAASRAQQSRIGARHADHLTPLQGHRADSWASHPLTEVGHDQERRLVLGHMGKRLLVDRDGILGCLRGPIG